ncbi:MAG: nucleotidyltransferase [Roseburia sp.]
MKVTGIIAEYNPFHNGHLYQLTEARKKTDADFIIVVMSGDFMQRGTPAIINKWERTRMALSGGADLVLELPCVFATASANMFALGGISLLARTGVVTDLCFGAETDSITDFLTLAKFLNEEPDFFKNALKNELKTGISFPAARSSALSAEASLPLSSEKLLSSPNNILGIEYCKALFALSSSIKPHIIKREGSGYNDREVNKQDRFASASAIRTVLLNPSKGRSSSDLSSFLPASSLDILKNSKNKLAFLSENDFSLLLHYQLLREMDLGFSSYSDVSKDLSNRIKNRISGFTSWSDFALSLKTKELTYTRINRALTHILLGITDDNFLFAKSNLPLYLRILGFSKNASLLLSSIKHNSSIPLISKLADAKNSLSDASYDMLKADIFASDIYRTVKTAKTGQNDPNEFKQSLILL